MAVERLEPRLALATVGLPQTNSIVILGNHSGQPLVQVLDPMTGAERVRFLAYESSFRGGVRVFGADVTGDGLDEILVAPGPGRISEIRVFTHTGVELPAYRTRPFGDGFFGGVEVAAGPVTAPGSIDIVAAQETRGNLVRVFSVTTGLADPVADVAVRQFQPFGPRFVGGARLTTADTGTFSGGTLTAAAPDGVFEILVGTRPGMRANVVAHNAVTSAVPRIATFHPLSTTAASGVFMARLPGAGGTADRILVSGGGGMRRAPRAYDASSAMPPSPPFQGKPLPSPPPRSMSRRSSPCAPAASARWACDTTRRRREARRRCYRHRRASGSCRSGSQSPGSCRPMNP
jgi:hypothetical protein